jgi:hypothetical protein
MTKYTNNLFQLLKETFEGPPAEGGSAYLDKGAGLFQTLEKVDAEMASRSTPSIASHCEHLRYYVQVLHNFLLEKEQKVDWPGSWRVQGVTPEEWRALVDQTRADYEDLVSTLESVSEWDEDAIGESMAIVVHSAYHLGAIRQMVKR